MSTKPLRILVLVCSTRPGALGPVIGEWLTRTMAPTAAEHFVELVPVSLADVDLPFLDEEEHPSTGIYRNEHTRRWSAIVGAADGFVVVTPEYNYGMPATLKNALDYLSGEWAWKPVGFVSYGNTSAGTRSVQHAKQVVTTLRLVPLGATLAIRIGEAVENDRLRPDAYRDQAAVQLLEELVRVSHALRPLREREQNEAVPGPLPGSYLRRLAPFDAAQVAVLQRCCWVDEAFANDTLAIPALQESLEDVEAWLTTWHTWGLWQDGRLVGMVRARRVDDTWHVGRLGVVPDLRGRGLGSWLLRVAEDAREPGCRHIVLSTGARSETNIRRYESAGYQQAAGTHEAGAVRLAKLAVGQGVS
ncbi:NAD(P)H-dependent FMN reductase [Actinopolymorpha cephalotaxi]|uniref:NAD(P)H-dependent FMN reductase n=1 Tax=Actinopolymorpha cephalotaxi TaxID=504797 RepID=A0A1I2Z300_9ACTN|nr:bifunctional NAD(P)H-dependent oxidoreductase/GNAT family N-acetyltransferase [Actinopolymorpha cephalotaxi]NYH81834.1 NAD(P)H-dependent FMN reductase/GNAT superfamily N-acetyltransferase [Actinopolymorpha cephalotaxi]SFH32233.1 NAD(P)H-dependent FMN reductase [Actinopolymorpha cephalotaxi]